MRQNLKSMQEQERTRLSSAEDQSPEQRLPKTAGPGSEHNEPSSEYQLQMPGVSGNNMQMAAVSETPQHLSSDMHTNGGLSIVAKKRPPPMQIGWNDYGIAPDR